MASTRMVAAAVLIVGLLARATIAKNTAMFDEVESPALEEIQAPLNGIAGGAWLDVDGDGDLDFVTPGDSLFGEVIQWLENLGDDGFAARTLDANITDLPDAFKESGRRVAILAADFNNDGLVDLYTSGCDSVSQVFADNCSRGYFYESLGGGKYKTHRMPNFFTRVNEWTASAGDVNGDGLLDLFVGEALHVQVSNVDKIGTSINHLYINKGDFQFEESGVDVENPGTCISGFADVDLDGQQDLITASCNIFEYTNDSRVVFSFGGPVKLLKNTFREKGVVSFEDVTKKVFGDIDDGLWMGMSMADLNNDGRLDFFFGNSGVDFKNEQHLLLMSQPDGTYRNESVDRGVAWHGFNWGSAFVDMNNDGNPDLVTVGAMSDVPHWVENRNPGKIFVNLGGGDFSEEGDLGLFSHLCSGLSAADFDEDGSQDIMVVCSTVRDGVLGDDVLNEKGRIFLFKGTAPKDRHISFELEGVRSNSQGIGANVQICAMDGNDEVACQTQVVAVGSSFASTHSPILHFGVPEPASLVDVEVIWPSGMRDAFLEVEIGHRYKIKEGSQMVDTRKI